MKNITVTKTGLIAKLGENRSKHVNEYEAARIGWHQKMLDALTTATAEFDRTEETKDLNFAYRFPKPESHVDEYDRALEMLDWETENLITLSEQDFRHFVQDDWDWTQSHRFSSSQYIATS
jgi:hypothetical protein